MAHDNPNDNSGRAGYLLFYALILFITFIVLVVFIYNKNMDALPY